MESKKLTGFLSFVRDRVLSWTYEDYILITIIIISGIGCAVL